MKRPTLGVVMIVRNEEKNLGGILSDIRGIVDEICIVDTGSQDGTISIAESFGARIGHFPWINDFAAARNHSIELAGSDYLLWLDADDRLDERDRKAVTTLKTKLRHQKDRAYLLKIYSSSEDAPDSVSYQARIIPNRHGVRFEGRVHEQILPALEKSAIKVEPLDIIIRHTGYHDAKARPAKARRNLDILLQELQDGKDTANQHFFIAMAYIALKENEQCLACLAKARQKRRNEDWYHISFVIATECLLRLDRVEDALREIVSGIAIFPDSPLLHYYHGYVCMQAELFREAVEAFGKAADLPSRIDAYPIPPDLETIILIQYGKALEKTGRMDDAIAAYTRALQSGTHQKDLHHALGMALLQGGKIDEAVLHLTTVKDMTNTVNVPLWLSLAKIHSYRKSPDQAHTLYLDILHDAPTHLEALAGILGTSIELDKIETFLSALEQLMLTLEIPIPEATIDSLAECAELCMKTAFRLKETGQHALAEHLAEIAVRLDVSSSSAHLFLADLFAEKGDTSRMLASLETALKTGADGDEILRRIELAEHISDTSS